MNWNPLRNALRPWAGLGLAALVIAVAAPPAVKAVAAALVQVANTPATAVPTLQAPAASQLYYDVCVSYYNGTDSATCTFAPVPAGHTLIVDTLTVRSFTGHGKDPYSTEWSTSANAFYVPMQLQVSSAVVGDTYVGTLPSRIWGSAGSVPVIYSQLTGNDAGNLRASLGGYLIPAQ